MVNNSNGNQFREDAIIILDQLRDGKWVKNIFPKIAGMSLLLQRGEVEILFCPVIRGWRQEIRGFAQPRAL
jgi:hypothetical protein